jgi:integrase
VTTATRAKKAPAKNPRRKSGEGSYKLRKDGLYEGSLELPRGDDGKRRRAYVTGKVERDVTNKLNALKVKLAKRGDIRTDNPTVDQWIDYWLANICSVKPRTRVTYVGNLKHVRNVIGTKRISVLTPHDIRAVHKAMAAAGLSATTVRATHGLLASVLGAAVREQVADDNVCLRLDPPKAKHFDPEALTPDEARELMFAVADDRLGSRWAAALLTGARQGELLGLTWDRVDFEANTIDLAWQLQRVPWNHGCLDDDREVTCGHRRAIDCPTKHIIAEPDFERIHLYDGHSLVRPKTKTGNRVIPLVDPLRAILLRHRERSAADRNPHNLVWTAGPKQRHQRGVYILDGRAVDPTDDSREWHDVLHRIGIEKRGRHASR